MPLRPDHQVVRIAVGERGHDLHASRRCPCGRNRSRPDRCRPETAITRMFAGVLDGQAEVAAPLVQVERAGLEDGLGLAAVEIAEGDEVVAAAGTGRDGSAPASQPRQWPRTPAPGSCPRRSAWSASPWPCRPESARTRSRPSFATDPPAWLARPAVVGAKLCQQLAPLRLGQGRLIAQQRLDGVGVELGERVSPGGVDALCERQRPARLDARQREARRSRRLVRVRSLAAKRQVFLLLAVEGVDGARRQTPRAGSA